MEQNIFLQEYFNHSIIVLAKKCIKYSSDSTRIDLRKSNGMSEENITKPDTNFVQTLVDHVFCQT